MVSDKSQERTDTTQSPEDSESTPAEKEPTPAEKETTPKSYSEQEMREAKTEARMWEGRVKSLEREKGTFQSKITDLETRIGGLDEEKANLQKQIDELTIDDPEKSQHLKEMKKLNDDRKRLDSELTEFEAKRDSASQEISDAKTLNRLATICVVAMNYENGNADRLADLCEKFVIDSEKDIEELADSLWGDGKKPDKQEKKEKPEPIVPDSGKTRGGGETTEKDILKGMYPSMFPK